MKYVQHLLTLLMEECAEVAQVASKCIRFGGNDYHPKTLKVNIDRLREEYNDLLAVVELLNDKGWDIMPSRPHIDAKKEKVKRYAIISKNLGMLELNEGDQEIVNVDISTKEGREYMEDLKNRTYAQE